MEIVRWLGSKIDAATKAVMARLDNEDGSNDKATDTFQQMFDQPVFSALGIVARPRPPTRMIDGRYPVYAEAFTANHGDGFLPFSYRDLRLNQVYSNPKDGSIALVGYGGAFLAFDDTTTNSGDQLTSVATLYAPYQFSSGVPAKAHAITVDTTPGNESVTIVHGDGMAITMKTGGKHSVVVKNKAGDSYVEVNDDGIVVNGNTVINGGATIGSPVGALPAAIATPLVGYLTALETLLGAVTTDLDSKGPPSVPPGLAVAAMATFTSATTALKAAIPATKTSIA